MSAPRNPPRARIEAHKAAILSALAETTVMDAMIDSELTTKVGEAKRFLMPALIDLHQAGLIDSREVWHPGQQPFMCYWRVAQASSLPEVAPYRPRDKGREERKRREAKCNDGLAVPEKRGNVRACLCCKKPFLSQGAHNRLCTTCCGKSVGPYDL